jgi:hypothetical protein
MRGFVLTLLGVCAACSTAHHAPLPCGLVARFEPAPPEAGWAPDIGEPEFPQGAPQGRTYRSDDAYVSAMAGVFVPGGDLRDLDNGRRAQLVIGRDLVPSVSVELEAGYLDTEGQFRGSEFTTYALPVFVNWRFRLPIPIVRPYIGAGAGFFYADYEFVGVASTTEYLFAWNAFGGVEVEIGSVAFGAEYQFVQSEDADETAEIFNYEGQCLTAFVSLRF